MQKYPRFEAQNADYLESEQGVEVNGVWVPDFRLLQVIDHVSVELPSPGWYLKWRTNPLWEGAYPTKYAALNTLSVPNYLTMKELQ